jgi:nucleotide-binding universal stress UspA family protein
MSAKMKILVAYDGSEGADRALNDIKLAGLPQEAEALVTTVAEVWLQPPPSSYDIIESPFAEATTAAAVARAVEHREAEAAHEFALGAAKRIESIFPRWEVRGEALTGSPASTILKKAEEWEADLIVVGPHGRTAIGRLILGSISRKIVTEAHCSVRVARGRERLDNAPVRLLVGLDGSDCAQDAARTMAARDWPAGTEVRVVAAYDALVPTVVGQFIPPIVRVADEANREERAWVREIVEASARELRRRGLIVSPAVIPGDPRRALIEEARCWRADSIFVGARGLSRLDRFLLGSVSAAIAARAHCSVEVVRAKAAQKEK